MGLWSLCILSFFLALFFSKTDVLALVEAVAKNRQINLLFKIESNLAGIASSLEVGRIPSTEVWESLQHLPKPWGSLAGSSLQELRASGGAILPTLKRIKNLVQDQRTALIHAHSKSSQALAQAMVCTALVPLLGFALYSMIPGIEQNPRRWLVACGFSVILAGIGGLWLLNMSQKARWGGLQSQNYSWILGSQCAGERLLALVRAGTPPDLAWLKACQLLAADAQELATAWGHSIWDTPDKPLLKKSKFTQGVPEQSIITAGISIRKAIQLGLMEGTPCLDRIETALEALREDMRAHIERELTVLPTRALKPLFIFIAPALLGLLAFGIYLASAESLEGIWNVEF